MAVGLQLPAEAVPPRRPIVSRSSFLCLTSQSLANASAIPASDECVYARRWLGRFLPKTPAAPQAPLFWLGPVAVHSPASIWCDAPEGMTVGFSGSSARRHRWRAEFAARPDLRRGPARCDPPWWLPRSSGVSLRATLPTQPASFGNQREIVRPARSRLNTPGTEPGRRRAASQVVIGLPAAVVFIPMTEAAPFFAPHNAVARQPTRNLGYRVRECQNQGTRLFDPGQVHGPEHSRGP
jgi:hypothetical protein